MSYTNVAMNSQEIARYNIPRMQIRLVGDMITSANRCHSRQTLAKHYRNSSSHLCNDCCSLRSSGSEGDDKALNGKVRFLANPLPRNYKTMQYFGQGDSLGIKKVTFLEWNYGS